MSVRFSIVSYAVLAALTASAWAETDALDAQGTIETVVVTAQKRAQNPIEVPMALTAYTGDFMNKAGLQEFDKLSLLVPGFVVQNQSPNNPGFGLRGLTLDSGEAAQEPRVSVFEDDVSISTTRGTYIELFDIERIEVAKGPQTTLFGRSALMGGVNVIQNKAKLDTFEGAASGEVGTYNYRMIEGMVNIPLADGLAVRMSGRYKSRDGYVNALAGGTNYNSVNTGAARLAFAFKPNEAFDADIIFNFEQDAPSGTSFKSGTFAPSDPSTGQVLGTVSHNSGATLNTVAGFEDGKRLGLNRQVWDGKALLKYKFSNALSLNSVTAYRRFDSEEVFDPDGFSKPILEAAEDERGDQISQELRLNYDNGGWISGFVGTDYFYANTSQRVPMQFDEFGALSLLTWGTSSTYSATMYNMLQNYPTAAFDTAMASFASSYLTSSLYSSYYSAYYNALVGAYGSTVAAAQAKTMATQLSSLYGPALAGKMKTNHWEQSTNYGKTKSIDLYGDVTVRAGTDWEFEGGLRFTHDDKQTALAATLGDRSILGLILGGQLPTVLGSTTELSKILTTTAIDAANPDAVLDRGIMVQPTKNNGDKVGKDFSDDGLSWRFSARYAVDDTTNLYATYARGRRPKVLSVSSPKTPYGTPTFTDVPAEQVDSYEVGAKTLALDGTLRADAALYFYDYTNFQTTRMENNTFVTSNAGKAESYGIEATADWTFASWGDVFATYTYSRARFVGETAYRGNQFRLNPDHKASIGANLHRLVPGGTFNFMPTYTWQSKIYFDDDNDKAALQTGHFLPDTARDEVQKQYGLLNLRMSYTLADRPISFTFFINNVLDQKFIKDAGNSGDNLGIPTFIAGEPRMIGGNVSIKFH